MDRRRFLTAGGISTVALAASGFWSGAPAPLEPEVLAQPALRATLGDFASIHALGRRYRAVHPEEDRRAALVEVLRGAIGPGLGSVRDRLDARVRADFAQGRTVQLDGWILSVTEARQCALYSLRHDRGNS
ncbi:MAG: hypothetical protein GVY35_07350 [Bacteroidetes bacterium]|nr:hypothetical protein [Bacteroidota bacterium]